MPMQPDASSFRQAVMVYPSSLQKFASPQELTSTNSCRVKLTFTTAQRCWFLRSRPTSHACSSKHQQTTSSRPPFFVEVCPRSITPANQFRQLFSGPNQFQMHVSRALNVAQNSFQTSHVTLGRRGTRHCQRLCRVMQVELKYIKMPTTDRYVSASEPFSISWSSFAADSFRTIGVLVGLQLSIPSIASKLSACASLLLRAILPFNFVVYSPKNNTDLPFSMKSTRLIEFQRFLQLHKEVVELFSLSNTQEIVHMHNHNDRVLV